MRPRSGLALKHAMTMPNAPGTILLNPGRERYRVQPGERIAQMIVSRYEAVDWEEGELALSRRGEGGFGSSGR